MESIKIWACTTFTIDNKNKTIKMNQSLSQNYPSIDYYITGETAPIQDRFLLSIRICQPVFEIGYAMN